MPESLATFPLALVSSFTLVGLAEIGDKSQLVCMTLAARYRGWPVLLGATMAFGLLNLLAVLFGAAVARWLPGWLVVLVVGALFIAFGVHALRNTGAADERDDTGKPAAGHGVFLTTFLMITLAEFGDKTQLAVAGMSSAADPVAVWLGATLALAGTSGFGVWAGRTLLQRIPLVVLHRLSAVFFILLGLVALASLLR